jgi:hypothetical protein
MVLTIYAKLVGDIPSDDIAIVKNEEQVVFLTIGLYFFKPGHESVREMFDPVQE